MKLTIVTSALAIAIPMSLPIPVAAQEYVQTKIIKASNKTKVEVTNNSFTGSVDFEISGEVSSTGASSWSMSCKTRDACSNPIYTVTFSDELSAPYGRAVAHNGHDVPHDNGYLSVLSCRGGCTYLHGFQFIVSPDFLKLITHDGKAEVMMLRGSDTKLVTIPLSEYQALMEVSQGMVNNGG